MLTRFWFRFDLKFDQPHPTGTLLGCGVTASSKEEAIEYLKKIVFRTYEFPRINECIEGVDVASLDKGHVQPNMDDPTRPGVWFPFGYREEQ
jgi:hypothetical protein